MEDQRKNVLLKFPWQIWIRVIFASFFMTCCGGIVFGYSALKPLLLDSKVFFNLCGGSINSTNCDAQNLALNTLPQVSSAGVNLLAFPASLVAFKLKRRKTAFLSSGLFFGFLVLFGLTYQPYIPSWIQIWLLPLCFLALAVGGAGFFMVVSLYAQDMKEINQQHSANITSLLTACWDLSACIFNIFNALHFDLNFSLLTLCCGYAGIMIVPLLVFSYFIEPPSETSNTLEQLTEVSSNEVLDLLKKTWKDIKSPIIISIWTTMSLLLLNMYFYISTLPDQAFWITGNREESLMLSFWFSILLPVVGFLANFPLGYVLSNKERDRKTTWRGWPIVTILVAVSGILSIIKNGPLQYVTYILFITWRILSFITLYSYIIENYEPEKFGILAFGSLTLAGAVTYFSLLLNWITVSPLGNDYTTVNAFLTIASTLSGIILSYLSYNITLKPSESSIRLTILQTPSLNRVKYSQDSDNNSDTCTD